MGLLRAGGTLVVDGLHRAAGARGRGLGVTGQVGAGSGGILRPLRSATITINGATQTFPPDIAEPQRKILTALGINMAY